MTTPKTRAAMAILAALPLRIIMVTNQSPVGRKLLTREGLDRIHAHLLDGIRAAGGRIDAIYLCPHHPDDACACRKPKPGLLVQAAADLDLDLAGSYFIGDAATDVRAAHAAGCRAVLVETGHGCRAREELSRAGVGAYIAARDLLEIPDAQDRGLLPVELAKLGEQNGADRDVHAHA